MSVYKILAPEDPALAALETQLRSHSEWQTSLTILPWPKYQAALHEALRAKRPAYQAVAVPGHIWLPGLVSAGQVAPLDPLLAQLPNGVWRTYVAEDLMPCVQAEAHYQGRRYLVPLFTDGHLLFYRRDLVSIPAAPEDGSKVPTVPALSLAELAAGLDLPAGMYPLALKAHHSEILLDWLPYLWEAGGDVLDASGRPQFAGPAGVAALEYYLSLRAYCPPDTAAYGNYEIAQALVSGKVAMAASWGGQAAVIFAANNPQRAKMAVAVFPRPWNATWGLCLPANLPEKTQVSMLAVLLQATVPVHDRMVTRVAGSPVRQSSYLQTKLSPSKHATGNLGSLDLTTYPWLAAQAEMLRRAGTLPGEPRLAAFLGSLYDAIGLAFSGQYSPAEALRLAEERAIQALRN